MRVSMQYIFCFLSYSIEAHDENDLHSQANFIMTEQMIRFIRMMIVCNRNHFECSNWCSRIRTSYAIKSIIHRCARHISHTAYHNSLLYFYLKLFLFGMWSFSPTFVYLYNFWLLLYSLYSYLLWYMREEQKKKKRVQINCDHAWPNLSISYFIPLQFRIQSFTRAGYVLLSMFESTNALHKCIRYV